MPALAFLASFAALALAQSDGPSVKAGGFASERLGYALGWDSADPSAPGVARLAGVPSATSLTEANLQLRVRLGEGYDVFTDLSLFMSAQSEATGTLPTAAGVTNRIEPSELYANLGFHEHLNGLLGRKRLVWGSGFAWNPTDLLNPLKDPTDPTLQRAGAWMARLEAPFERFTLTGLWAPKIVRTQAGLPSRVFYEPGGREAMQLFAARVYALVQGADMNLMWFWSNRYADSLPHSHRFAASFSRYFLDDYELHVEGIVQRGRDTAVVDPTCLPTEGSLAPLLACRATGRPVVTSAGLSDPSALFIKLVVGTRYSFPDESLLSVEYFFNGPGLDSAQFADRLQLLDLLPTLYSLSSASLDLGALLSGEAAAGQPLRFDLRTQRRHYLLLVFQKPRIADDLTASATAIVGLEGPSALLSPSVSWSVREWLSLSLFAFIPAGSASSEFGSLPFRFRALFEARVYY
ncbi:MAG: hypothetical protein HY901_09505 [Deltaproteobacteria bacterium]|nr:hypothetical protein [Deltaproteobacteria bacterium]